MTRRASPQLLLAIVLFTVLSASASAQIVVEFPDPNLESAIRTAIGKPTGSIYDTDLVGLFEPIAVNAGISDLTGMEYCTSLLALVVYDNSIVDISPLANLTSLRVLYLGDNPIVDLDSLAGLVNLEGLSIQNISAGSDLSSLAGLVALKVLFIHDNEIINIGPLAGLTKLESLYATKNQISDLGALTGLSNLSILQLSQNQISNLGALAGLINLSQLELRQNQISNTEPLRALTKLEVLTLDHNQISSVDPLTGLTSLWHLHLQYNQISDLGPLVVNSGIGSGDMVRIWSNPLDCGSVLIDIPALSARGADVTWDDVPSCRPDADGDSVLNVNDNCLLKFNPDQIDTDGDHCGNQCDADFTQDGTVGSGDFFVLANAYGSLVPAASPNIDVGPDPLDGAIGAADFFILATSYGGAPGPSWTTSGTTACP